MDRPVYKITIDEQYSDGEDLGVEMIAFTNKPAIKVKGMAFSSHAVMTFSDSVKMRIVAPAMIPMNIYRQDEDGEEYDVQFSSEVIEQIHAKFMLNLQNKDIFNLEHDQDEKVPAYILEAWIVDSPETDKAFTTYGIEVPKGTLMLTSQVTDREYYDKLVESGQVGYSVEGFLGMKLSQHLNKYTMKLPDGEHMIEDKIYVVKDGEIIEIKEMPTEMEAELAADPVAEEEEAAAAENPVAEEEDAEADAPVAMAVDPALDAEAVLAIVAPMLEEHMNAVIRMIADLKNQLEESLAVETETETENVELTSHEKFKEYVKFSKTK
jgi:Putative phage serine protease XkdF